jgi:hypothetical protein
MTDHGLGRLRAIDQRNKLHPMARHLRPPGAPLPLRKTWAFLGPNVLDQGGSGTCTGHAGVHFIHCAPLSHKAFLNPYALYREAVLLDEYPDNDGDATLQPDGSLQAGSSGTGIAKALAKRDLIQAEYVWGNTSREAIEWVLTRGPVMMGSNWYEGMFNPSLEGFVRIKENDTIAGGHEYVIRGVDQKRAVADLVNSWGTRWNSGPGKKCRPGFFLMDFETLERLFNEDGDAVSCLEKKPVRT